MRQWIGAALVQITACRRFTSFWSSINWGFNCIVLTEIEKAPLAGDWPNWWHIPAYTSRKWIVWWWRHQMETFSSLLAICAGNGEFTTQRPVTRSFDVFFDLRLNKRFSTQWWGWWFETLSRPLWCHRNVLTAFLVVSQAYLWQRHDPVYKEYSLDIKKRNLDFLSRSRLTPDKECTPFNKNTLLITLPFITTSKLRQNGRHFADDVFKIIFFNERCGILMRSHWRVLLSVLVMIKEYWLR